MRVVFAVVATVLAACGGIGPDRSRERTPWEADALLVATEDGVVTIDASTGQVVADVQGVPSLGDWSRVVTASAQGGRTLVERRDATDGSVEDRIAVPGELSVRVASHDGDRVALMRPLAPGESPWVPQPRATTDLVVADLSGPGQHTRYRLEGNVEPEAFSTDGRTLFLIRFVPPTDPTGYRVAALSLDDGQISAVRSAPKAVVETMSGTRLEQLASADGTMLYTLYTTQPGAGVGAHAGDGDAVGFVHTLSLREGWAHCIALPEKLWGGDPSHQAMALSPDAERLYVVDTERGGIGVMDTSELRMIGDDLDLDVGSGRAVAATTSEGTLVVAAGERVATVDPSTFEVLRTASTGGSAAALGTGPDGVYVATTTGIDVVGSSGRSVGTIPSPPVDDIVYLGAVPA